MKGKSNSYQLESLKNLYWTEKQLLLPIIGGGIISSISVVAYMNNLLHPWMLIFLLISGILAMYYGFVGSPALEVVVKNYSDFYLIREKDIFLKEFTDFVNSYLTRKEAPCYLIEVTTDEWKKANETGEIIIAKPRRLLNKVTAEGSNILLQINFQQLKGGITYLQGENNNSLSPFITENVPLTAVSVVG